MKRRNITGIILAGGKSSRMKCDKAMMIYRGKPLIQHATDILRQVCNKVVISANKTGYEFTGCEVWPDETDLHAPISGIYTCLKRSSSAWNFVLSCDMPLVDPRLFRLLLSTIADYEVIVPVHHADCIEPLCGAYHKKMVNLLESKIGMQQFSLRHCILESNHKLIEIGPGLDFYRSDMFVNLNVPEDFGLLPTS